MKVTKSKTAGAALLFLDRATRDSQSVEGIDANVAWAGRLLNLHLAQLEARQKLKGKAGQQKVIVKHVHVNSGGQAIVGSVTRVPGEREGQR
jgi:hypothetical protein